MLAATFLVAACASTTPGVPASQPQPTEQPALHILDIDGPGVVVMLGEQTLASVPCGGDAVVAPGGSMPQLPWQLTVLADDGGALSLPPPVVVLPATLLIRDRVALVGSWPMGSYGPAPANLQHPCASVPPWPTE